MGGHQSLMTAATYVLAIGGAAVAIPGIAFAQDSERVAPDPEGSLEGLRAELARSRAQLAEQQRLIAEQSRQNAEQQRRLDLLEQRLSGLAQTTQQIRDEVAVAPPAVPAASKGAAISVGEPPSDSDRAPTVAVLDQRGSVVTRKGQLIGELGLDYTRSDRNRAVFRGGPLSPVNVLLLGIFDINENRQDMISASASLRYGLTNRLEVGFRIPYLYRADTMILAPITGSTNNDDARTLNSSTRGNGIGDIELTARYQLNNGGRNVPFVIANLQVAIPTGRDPFELNRVAGIATESATGAGFWSVSPGITAILPSEPAVLFATASYTFNFSRNVNTYIPPAQIDFINPGDQISFAAGIGWSFNDRTSINLGYSHGWVFSTRSVLRSVNTATGLPVGSPFSTTSRDLQIGRLLLGVTHKLSRGLQLNWSIDAGITQDAPDLRVSLRVPIQF